MTGTDRARMAFRGLITNPNELAITGDGAMRRFTNGVLSRQQLAQRRRGVSVVQRNLAAPINKMFNYDDGMLLHVGSASSGQLKSLAGTTITEITGTLNPDSGKLRACISGKNFYTAGSAVKRLSGITSTPVAAGGLFAPGFDSTRTKLLAGTILPNGSAFAYRVVFGFTDAKDNLHLGEPSGRYVVINASGATANPTIRALIPSGATANHTIQFYRSTTVLSTQTPDDSMQLVFEQQLKAIDLTNKYVELTDVVPGPSALDQTDLRGPTIYTAPNLDGINGANRPPPGCQEICSHKNRTWFANTIQPAEFELRVISVGGSFGIQPGDVLNLSGITNPFGLTAVGDFLASLSRTTNVVTATVPITHGLTPGDYVMIAGGSSNFGIGPFLVASTADAFTFTYAEVAADAVLANQLGYKVASSAGPANGTYVVRSDTTAASVSARVAATVRNIADAFNKHTTNTELWAQVLEPADEPLPYLLFRGRTAATTSFFVSAGAGSQRDCFTPQLTPGEHIVNLSRAFGAVTATVTSGTQSMKIGEQVLIAPGNAFFSVGPHTITAVSSTTFVYVQSGSTTTLAAQSAQLYPVEAGFGVAEIVPNRVYYSKYGEHEATTRNGWVDIGGDKRVKALISQRGQIWAWKEDGVFKITGGDDPGIVPTDLAVIPVDTTINCLATESAVAFNNRCWGLTDKGVVAVSESGVEVMDGAISDDLRRFISMSHIYGDTLDPAAGTLDFESNCFATAYESERSYILHVPSPFFFDSAGAAINNVGLYGGGCPFAYVFNSDSGAWSIWDWGGNDFKGTGTVGDGKAVSKSCAMVSMVDGKLYLGDAFLGAAGDGYVYAERKALSSSDYRDTVPVRNVFSLARVTTAGVGTVTATGPSGSVPFSVGDQFRIVPGSANFGTGPFTVLTVSDTTFTYHENGSDVTLTLQTAMLERGVPITWAMVLQTNDAPSREKRWDELKLIFGQGHGSYPGEYVNSQQPFYVAFANELASVFQYLVESQGGQISRIWIDQDVARGTRLLVTITNSVIDTPFDLSGFSIDCEVLNGASTR